MQSRYGDSSCVEGEGVSGLVIDVRKPKPERELEVPGNATRTSDFEIPPAAWEAYLAALDRTDDMAIALEIRLRQPRLGADPVELGDFMREQGYDPADFEMGLVIDVRWWLMCRLLAIARWVCPSITGKTERCWQVIAEQVRKL